MAVVMGGKPGGGLAVPGADRMRVSIGQFNEATHEKMVFAKQLGCAGVLLNTPRLPGDHRWEYDDLSRLREYVESYGLRLEALENTPKHFYEGAMLGTADRDRQIEHYQATIRNVGRAGIPILGYHWMPNSVWRSQGTPLQVGRGGARVTAFDMKLHADSPNTHGRVYTADEMWENYVHFIKAVIPAAEDAGIKLALHPDDPPVPMLGGVARIFGSFEGFKRGSEAIESDAWGMDFCMGCWSEMGGHDNVMRGIEHFVPRGKILYAHCRDVNGPADCFAECFLGEGQMRLFEIFLAFKKHGFTGFLIDDHVPHMVDDSDWGHRGRAHATGYMLATLDAVEAVLAGRG